MKTLVLERRISIIDVSNDGNEFTLVFVLLHHLLEAFELFIVFLLSNYGLNLASSLFHLLDHVGSSHILFLLSDLILTLDKFVGVGNSGSIVNLFI